MLDCKTLQQNIGIEERRPRVSGSLRGKRQMPEPTERGASPKSSLKAFAKLLWAELEDDSDCH